MKSDYQNVQNPEENIVNKFKPVRKYLAWDRKHFGKAEIQAFLKGSSHGFPYYFTSPKLQTVVEDQSSFVPMIVKKSV